MINQLLIILFAYLVGSISSGIIVSRFFNLPDPRTIGSKNPGATNVMRSGNKKAAIFTLLGDLLKAIFVLAIAEYLGFDDLIIVCVALAVLIGHIYPIFYKFRGGKGVATAIGIIFLAPAIIPAKISTKPDNMMSLVIFSFVIIALNGC